MTDHILTFDAPATPISMNQGDTWSVRRDAAAWRDRAYYAWCHHWPNTGPSGRNLPPSAVHTALPFPTNRRRDPINYAKTVKHIVDGLTQAGAWPDDTPNWVTQHIPTLHPGTTLVIITITPQ